MQKLLFSVTLLFTSAIALAAPHSIEKVFPEGERLVYAKLIQAYRKADLPAVVKQKKLLEQNYPHSIHLDNAYYLLGALQFHEDQFGESLKTFDHLLEQFPESPKCASALYAMAMTYKKLNLHKQSVAVLDRIVKRYPGSPDSHRAVMELRIAKEGVPSGNKSAKKSVQ